MCVLEGLHQPPSAGTHRLLQCQQADQQFLTVMLRSSKQDIVGQHCLLRDPRTIWAHTPSTCAGKCNHHYKANAVSTQTRILYCHHGCVWQLRGLTADMHIVLLPWLCVRSVSAHSLLHIVQVTHRLEELQWADTASYMDDDHTQFIGPARESLK